MRGVIPRARYAFITVSGSIFAMPVDAGSTGASCGGIAYTAREPANADERRAVRALEADLRRAAQRPEIRELSRGDAVTIMARKIAERARQAGQVERIDFRQAGIPDDLIDQNLDAAFARARRMEPRLDAMAGTP